MEGCGGCRLGLGGLVVVFFSILVLGPSAFTFMVLGAVSGVCFAVWQWSEAAKKRLEGEARSLSDRRRHDVARRQMGAVEGEEYDEEFHEKERRVATRGTGKLEFVPPQIAPIRPASGTGRSPQVHGRDRRRPAKQRKSGGEMSLRTTMYLIGGGLFVVMMAYAAVGDSRDHQNDKEVIEVVTGYLEHQNKSTEKLYWCDWTEPKQLKDKDCIVLNGKDMVIHYRAGGKECTTTAEVSFGWGETAHYDVSLDKSKGRWAIYKIGE